jgi:hypothetical protein
MNGGSQEPPFLYSGGCTLDPPRFDAPVARRCRPDQTIASKCIADGCGRGDERRSGCTGLPIGRQCDPKERGKFPDTALQPTCWQIPRQLSAPPADDAKAGPAYPADWALNGARTGEQRLADITARLHAAQERDLIKVAFAMQDQRGSTPATPGNQPAEGDQARAQQGEGGFRNVLMEGVKHTSNVCQRGNRTPVERRFRLNALNN